MRSTFISGKKERRKEERRPGYPLGALLRAGTPPRLAHYKSEAGAVTAFCRCSKGAAERFRTCQGHKAPPVAELIGPQLCLIPEPEVLPQAAEKSLLVPKLSSLPCCQSHSLFSSVYTK